MRLTGQVSKSSPGGRGPAPFEEESSSATHPAATGVAGCQSARTQQDAWCKVDYFVDTPPLTVDTAPANSRALLLPCSGDDALKRR